MYRFTAGESLARFQGFIEAVYGLPDNRLFSLSDLLANQQRFTMRALKGIRKGNREKLTYNLAIAFSWLVAVVNRLHIDIEGAVWRRFPSCCSYCGKRPCVCKALKAKRRVRILRFSSRRPKTLAALQGMFQKIYPAEGRTLAEAGVHLAEEMGEVSEAVHVFLGEHKEKQFKNVTDELADYVSCIMGVANSAEIDLAETLAHMFTNNCHICHKAPCACKFSFVANFDS